MGGPAQIWAARSADTDARLTRASCAQSTRPGSLSAAPGPLLPHTARARAANNRSSALQRDPRGHAWEALEEASVDWSAQPPRRCLEGARVTAWPQQESTHKLPSGQTQVLSGLPAFAPAVASAWNHHSESSPSSPALPLQPRPRSSSAHPSGILHTQGHTLP